MKQAKQFRKGVWYQVGGDMNASTYGCVLACFDGMGVDIREIQPTVEYVGEKEAAEVGFPFWSREAWYSDADLIEGLCDKGVWDSMDLARFLPEAVGMDDLTYEKVKDHVHRCGNFAPWRWTHKLRFAVAEELLRYGWCTDEGPSGWSADVLPCMRPSFWRDTVADWREEDREFKRMVREHQQRSKR